MEQINATIINFNKNYNIIKLYRGGGIIEYYLEKIDFGGLYFIVGTTYEIALTYDYVIEAIKIAEDGKFWN